MSSGAIPCTPCCSTTQNVQVPGIAGADGSDGADGASGISAYTLTTADFTVPAVGDQVAVAVGSSLWMMTGQPIYIEGPANFTVVSKSSSTSVVLQFEGFEDDVAPTTVISAGSGVSPGGTQASAITSSRLSVYAAGTPYNLTTTAALLDFGTTDPSLTITEAGTWLILARARIDYFWATYAADNVEYTLKLRRTNNTAADLTNGSTTFKLRNVTTAYQTADLSPIPAVIYSTTNTDDVIQLWGSVASLPSTTPTGAMRCYEAEIIAIKIAE